MKIIRFSLAILAIVSSFLVLARNFYRQDDLIIPVEYLNSYQIPCTSIEIEGTRYSVEVDLGSKTALTLHKSVLDKMRKTLCGTIRRIDFRGNKYETSAYIIPKIKMGSLLLKKIKTKEESVHFLNEGSIVIKAQEQLESGRIGRDLFLGKNLFLDFKNYTMVACNQLKDIPYKTLKLVALPFKNTSNGFVLTAETDMGQRAFMLDTGATVSVFKPEAVKEHLVKQQNGMQFIETSKFAMNGVNLGPRSLYLLEMDEAFKEIDGLLGMDFLKEYWVYLDFAKEMAYIGKNETTWK